MEKKVFSFNDVDGYLEVENGDIYLDTKEGSTVATTSEIISKNNPDIYILPSSLIRKQPTDEELADEMYKDYEFSQIKTRGIFHEDRLRELDKSTFLAGRKSFGKDKKYHLSEEELDKIIIELVNSKYPSGTLMSQIRKNILPNSQLIYPHTITVDYEDGVYYWETLKAEY